MLLSVTFEDVGCSAGRLISKEGAMPLIPSSTMLRVRSAEAVWASSSHCS
jgi:hypothetical protein